MSHLRVVVEWDSKGKACDSSFFLFFSYEPRRTGVIGTPDIACLRHPLSGVQVIIRLLKALQIWKLEERTENGPAVGQ